MIPRDFSEVVITPVYLWGKLLVDDLSRPAAAGLLMLTQGFESYAWRVVVVGGLAFIVAIKMKKAWASVKVVMSTAALCAVSMVAVKLLFTGMLPSPDVEVLVPVAVVLLGLGAVLLTAALFNARVKPRSEARVGSFDLAYAVGRLEAQQIRLEELVKLAVRDTVSVRKVNVKKSGKPRRQGFTPRNQNEDRPADEQWTLDQSDDSADEGEVVIQPVEEVPKKTPSSPVNQKLSLCPACGRQVNLATHDCWVFRKKVRCYLCGEENHISVTCQGRVALSSQPCLEAVDKELKRLSEVKARLEAEAQKPTVNVVKRDFRHRQAMEPTHPAPSSCQYK